MIKLDITKLESSLLTFVFSIVGLGIYSAIVDHDFFKGVYTREDGLVETLSVFALLGGAAICITRIIKLKGKKPTWFLFCTGILATLFIFGAGEEISWGQRIFNTQSSEVFLKYNSQGETNLHNLEIVLESGKRLKINKIVFGTLLGIFIATYMLIMPPLYHRKEKIKKFIDSFAIPVPRAIHIIAYLILFIIVSMTPSHKKGELMEFGGVFFFFLITLYPVNRENFQ